MNNSILNSKIAACLESLNAKKIFLTGGTGFFGKSFLELITRFPNLSDFNVMILSRDPDLFLIQNPIFKNLKNVRFHKGDISSFNFPNETFDYILHFATPADAKMNIEQPLLMTEIIVEGTRHLLDFAVHCKAQKVLLTSSGAAYGPQPPDLKLTPESYNGAPLTNSIDAAYGESKRYAEFLGITYSKKHAFEFKIARCYAFAGKFLNKSGGYAMASFIDDVKNNQEIQINGDGTPYRSYLYADDLIVWLLTILLKGKNNEIYNVGSDQYLTIAELAKLVTKTLESNVSVRVHQSPKLGVLPSRYIPNIEKCKKELHLEVWTSLEETIIQSAQVDL